MKTPIYDTIGLGYNNTRNADPYIAERIVAQLQPTSDEIYLDIGCGTGNYTHHIAKLGYTLHGIDPSDTMLDIAKTKNINGIFTKATAEQIPYDTAFFNGAIAILTIHHWSNQWLLAERIFSRNDKTIW